MILINCITCDKDTFDPFFEKIDPKNGKKITVVICKKCGTIQVRPRPTEEETLAYYSEETYRVEKKVDDNAVHAKLLKRGERILYELKKRNFKIDTVLEIGCGIGSILNPFKKNGSIVIGYELNEKEVAYGKGKEIDIQVGTINDVPKDNTFDVIIYSHVIEHLVYPKKELTKIHSLLSEGGILVILLPGFYNMQAHKYKMQNYIVYPHLQYFTLRTLTNLLGQANFKCVYGEEEIFSLFVKSDIKQHIVSDYAKAIRAQKRFRFYALLYTPIFRLKRKTIKLLKI